MEHLRVVGAAMELRRSIVGLPVLCWSIETGCGMLLQPNVTPANDDTALPAGEELLRPKRDSGERRHCTTGREGAAARTTWHCDTSSGGSEPSSRLLAEM